MEKFIGIDLGGTTIKGAVVEKNGWYSKTVRLPTEGEKGGNHILENIMRIIGDLLEDSRGEAIMGVGIGTPGFVDENGNILHGGANLPTWTGTQIYEPIRKRYGIPVTAANDVTALALAELLFGAGRGAKNIVCFALGTGVGGGIVIGGKVYAGTYGMAGELGHISVETGGAKCACGQRGCLERYASATGIVRLAAEYAATHEFVETPLSMLVCQHPEEITAKMIYGYVASGDPMAVKVHETVCDKLGRAVGMMINALAPDRIILGGGVMMAGEIILNAVKSRAALYSWPAIYERCEIVPAQMGDESGVAGAGALAIEKFGTSD